MRFEFSRCSYLFQVYYIRNDTDSLIYLWKHTHTGLELVGLVYSSSQLSPHKLLTTPVIVLAPPNKPAFVVAAIPAAPALCRVANVPPATVVAPLNISNGRKVERYWKSRVRMTVLKITKLTCKETILKLSLNGAGRNLFGISVYATQY